jgi:tripartite-type tricarboxylate transporter receptor subunit TctC
MKISIAAALFPLVAGALQLAAPGANAQQTVNSYPVRSITLVVPFPPGGATDLMARTIGDRISRKWGKTVVIENKPGAGGVIAASQVAKASADGHTLLFGSTAQLAVNPSIYPKIPYDVAKDFAPVALVGSVPNILVAHPAFQAKSIAELIQYAKANPGKLNYGSPGTGSTAHLAAELFKMRAGIDIMHIPYKGAAGGVTDVLGGQVPLMFVSMPSVVEHVKSGKLQALGMTGGSRSSALPNVPTFANTLPGFEAVAWYGVVAPARTPPHIINMLNTEINAILLSDDVRKSFEAQGIDVLDGRTPEQFASYIKSETGQWSKVVEKAGIKVE